MNMEYMNKLTAAIMNMQGRLMNIINIQSQGKNKDKNVSHGRIKICN